MAWQLLAAAAISAAAGMYSSSEAADAASKGSKNALALQREQYYNALNMLEPTRALGYGATSDLATLYGYKIPEYTALNQMGGGGGSNAMMGGPITVKGRRSKDGLIGASYDNWAGGSLGNRQGRWGGIINPITGTVSFDNGKTGKKADKRRAMLEDYLRTGTAIKGDHPKLNRFIKEIDALRGRGYQYDPNAVNEQAAGPIAPAAGSGTSADGTAGNFSRFFTSPDYEFRRNEGIRGIEQGAAARGGALSGNAMRGVTEYNSNIASGEFGNYFERLMRMTGQGGAATNNAVSAGQNYANNGGNYMQAQGDARASGIMGAGNSVMNAANSGLNNWMLYRGGYFGGGGGSGYSLPSDIADFNYGDTDVNLGW